MSASLKVVQLLDALAALSPSETLEMVAEVDAELLDRGSTWWLREFDEAGLHTFQSWLLTKPM